MVGRTYSMADWAVSIAFAVSVSPKRTPYAAAVADRRTGRRLPVHINAVSPETTTAVLSSWLPVANVSTKVGAQKADTMAISIGAEDDK